MNITCPKCNTIFEFQESATNKESIKVKCSVCSYIWEIKISKVNDNPLKLLNTSYKKLIFLNLILIFLFFILLFLFKNDFKYIDSYWTNFYLQFEKLIPIK